MVHDPQTHIFVWCADRPTHESVKRALLTGHGWTSQYRVRSTMDRTDFSFYIEVTAPDALSAYLVGEQLNKGLSDYIEQGKIKIKHA